MTGTFRESWEPLSWVPAAARPYADLVDQPQACLADAYDTIVTAPATGTAVVRSLPEGAAMFWDDRGGNGE